MCCFGVYKLLSDIHKWHLAPKIVILRTFYRKLPLTIFDQPNILTSHWPVIDRSSQNSKFRSLVAPSSFRVQPHQLQPVVGMIIRERMQWWFGNRRIKWEMFNFTNWISISDSQESQEFKGLFCCGFIHNKIAHSSKWTRGSSYGFLRHKVLDYFCMHIITICN